MRVLITGSAGQVGRQLLITKPEGVDALGVTRAECDITSGQAISTVVEQFRPDAVINAAAYTDVDRAESDSEGAFAVNRDGAANVARAARRFNARLIQISTDYVFDGSRTTPYPTTAAPAPLSVYGASKRGGEVAVLESGASATIVRTAWIYSDSGKNFVTTVIRVLGSGAPMKVVNDRIGTPTSARDLADALWGFIVRPVPHDVLHWTNSGLGSWYDLAVAVREIAQDRGLLRDSPEIVPIFTRDLPPPDGLRAKRPAYSVLDCALAWKELGPARHWRIALAEILDELVATERVSGAGGLARRSTNPASAAPTVPE
jgi:dTDP-4-dehydrorhamnose reductase